MNQALGSLETVELLKRKIQESNDEDIQWTTSRGEFTAKKDSMILEVICHTEEAYSKLEQLCKECNVKLMGMKSITR